MNDKWWSTRLTLRFCLLWLGGIGTTSAALIGSPGMIPNTYVLVLVVLIMHVAVAVFLRKPQPQRDGLFREQRVALIAAWITVLCVLGLLVMMVAGLFVSDALAELALLMPLMFFSAATVTAAHSILLRRTPFYLARCPHCLYDLTSIESSTCPECGHAITPITPPQTAATQAPDR